MVQTWFNLMTPMNNPFMRIVVTGDEVAVAYNNALDLILNHPELSTWPYLLTLEDDNMPPPDGLLKLIETLEGGVDGQKYDVVGGLYWTKGEGGQPMCYGKPEEMPLNFRPWLPTPGTVARANGLGMGFNLWRLSMFKDARIARPLFRTVQEFIPGVGARQFTQDLWFYQEAGKLGYKFACDTRVLVGHYEASADQVW